MRMRMLSASFGRTNMNISIASFLSASSTFGRPMAEYVAHDHHERNRQGLGNTLIESVVPLHVRVGSVAVHDSVAS